MTIFVPMARGWIVLALVVAMLGAAAGFLRRRTRAGQVEAKQ